MSGVVIAWARGPDASFACPRSVHCKPRYLPDIGRHFFHSPISPGHCAFHRRRIKFSFLSTLRSVQSCISAISRLR